MTLYAILLVKVPLMQMWLSSWNTPPNHQIYACLMEKAWQYSLMGYSQHGQWPLGWSGLDLGATAVGITHHTSFPCFSGFLPPSKYSWEDDQVWETLPLASHPSRYLFGWPHQPHLVNIFWLAYLSIISLAGPKCVHTKIFEIKYKNNARPYRTSNAHNPANTGGRGGLTWQANWEFVESLWSIHSHFAQWISCEFVQKKSAKLPTTYFLNEPPGFFDNFVQNLPTICSSHSLRVLSKNAQKFDYNMPGGFFSKNSQQTLNVAHFTTNSHRTHWVYGWVHCDQTSGNFLKVCLTCPYSVPRVSPKFTKSGSPWAEFQGHSECVTQEHSGSIILVDFLSFTDWEHCKGNSEWTTWANSGYFLWENCEFSHSVPDGNILVTWSRTLQMYWPFPDPGTL